MLLNTKLFAILLVCCVISQNGDCKRSGGGRSSSRGSSSMWNRNNKKNQGKVPQKTHEVDVPKKEVAQVAKPSAPKMETSNVQQANQQPKPIGFDNVNKQSAAPLNSANHPQPPPYSAHPPAPPGYSPHGQPPPAYNPHGQAPPGYSPHGQPPPAYNPHGQAPPGYSPHGQPPPAYNPHGQAPPPYGAHPSQYSGYQQPNMNPHGYNGIGGYGNNGGYNKYGGMSGMGGFGGYGMQKSSRGFGTGFGTGLVTAAAGMLIWNMMSGGSRQRYTVHNYYNEPDGAPKEISLPANVITLCSENVTTLCVPNTTPLCTANETILCVSTVTVPCGGNITGSCVQVPEVCADCNNNTAVDPQKIENLPCIANATVTGNANGKDSTYCVTTMALPYNGPIEEGLPNGNSTNGGLENINTTQLSNLTQLVSTSEKVPVGDNVNVNSTPTT